MKSTILSLFCLVLLMSSNVQAFSAARFYVHGGHFQSSYDDTEIGIQTLDSVHNPPDAGPIESKESPRRAEVNSDVEEAKTGDTLESSPITIGPIDSPIQRHRRSSEMSALESETPPTIQPIERYRDASVRILRVDTVEDYDGTEEVQNHMPRLVAPIPDEHKDGKYFVDLEDIDEMDKDEDAPLEKHRKHGKGFQNDEMICLSDSQCIMLYRFYNRLVLGLFFLIVLFMVYHCNNELFCCRPRVRYVTVWKETV